MRTGPRWHVGILSGLTTLAVTASLAVTSGAAQGASTAPGRTPATQAVTRTVGAPAQSAARSFWTPARMKSATPAGQARRNGVTAAPAKPPGIPDPTFFKGVPTVGALFFTTGNQAHFCTASVVDSRTLNVVLTAAHCVYGSGPATNIAYVPKWHLGISPYGTWAVQSITVAHGWQQSQNPNLDFAFLTVGPPPGTTRPIERITGGLLLGVDTGYAHPVYVIGYNNPDSKPVGCASKSFKFEATQIEFYCNGYLDGTSGGPWIVDFNPVTGGGVVIGDIGGYEQGGDFPWASYSVYYSQSILRLFTQVQLHRAA